MADEAPVEFLAVAAELETRLAHARAVPWWAWRRRRRAIEALLAELNETLRFVAVVMRRADVRELVLACVAAAEGIDGDMVRNGVRATAQLRLMRAYGLREAQALGAVDIVLRTYGVVDNTPVGAVGDGCPGGARGQHTGEPPPP